MVPEFAIREATAWDCEELAAQMRPGDVAECDAYGYTPLEGLLVSMRQSRGAWALLLGGEVAAIFGALPVPPTTLVSPDTGYVWVLTGKAVDRHRFAFWRASRALLAHFARSFDFVTNIVDARYTASLCWLRRLGFEVHPAVAFGPQRRPFHPVTYRSSRWA